jgi:hypothetical protein
MHVVSDSGPTGNYTCTWIEGRNQGEPTNLDNSRFHPGEEIEFDTVSITGAGTSSICVQGP